MEILLQNKADVNYKDVDGNTALISVIIEDYIKFPSPFTSHYRSVSSEGCIVDMVSLLLKNGADVNAKSDDNTTALMVASDKGHTRVVSLLLQNGADVNPKDIWGDTALMAASERGHIEIVLMLLDWNADVNVINDNGHTAIDFANERGHVEIQNILKQHMFEQIISKTVERQGERSELVKEMDRRGIPGDIPAEIGMYYLGGKRKQKGGIDPDKDITDLLKDIEAGYYSINSDINSEEQAVVIEQRFQDKADFFRKDNVIIKKMIHESIEIYNRKGSILLRNLVKILIGPQDDFNEETFKDYILSQKKEIYEIRKETIENAQKVDFLESFSNRIDELNRTT